MAKGLKQTSQRLHTLSHGVMPVQIDSNGLRAALEELAATTDAPQLISCRFVYDAPIRMADNTAATHLFRIAQESLQNALRHSGAIQVVIALERQEDHIVLQIHDIGQGFDIEAIEEVARAGQGMGLPCAPFGWPARRLEQRRIHPFS